jgi:hypothetical protein
MSCPGNDLQVVFHGHWLFREAPTTQKFRNSGPSRDCLPFAIDQHADLRTILGRIHPVSPGIPTGELKSFATERLEDLIFSPRGIRAVKKFPPLRNRANSL